MPSFPKAMLADLKKSGLSARDAAALGLAHSDDERPCYAIPYLDLDGKPTGHFRVRFLGAPDELEKDKRGRPIRYSQPKGSAPRFYYAHIGGLKWKGLASDPAAPLYLTEGEKKAAALCKLGLPAIGLGGVWNWFEDGHTLDDFNLLTWSGRPVRIVFDSDVRTKTNVQKALRALADELIKRGAVPSEIQLPPLPRVGKCGVDDFLAHHGGGAKAIKALRSLPERPLLVTPGLAFEEIPKMKVPEQKWAVHGLVPVGLTQLCGKPKIGKSWLTLDLSIGVASGGKVLGVYETRRGDVLHLALEDTLQRFQSRLKRMLDGQPAPAGARFWSEWRRVEDHGLDALRRALEQQRDARLVIIDTLAKMRSRPSANSHLYLDDYDAIGQLKAIADEYGVGIVVVHHTRKTASDDPLDLVSGSTGLTGAADTILVLRKERGQADASLFVTGRDIAEQEIALQMEPRTMRWRALGDAEDYRIGQQRKQIIDTLAGLGQPAGASEVAELLGKKRVAVQRLMATMMEQGQLQWVPGGKYELKKGKTDEKQ